MSQLFHPATNTISKASIFGALFVIAAAAWIAGRIYRSPYVTLSQVVLEQPVMFSHKHHVQGLGIDCRYCHGSVENEAFAGLPSTQTCMNCHSQIWSGSPALEPVRESFKTGRAIRWNRVHRLADFAYFDHSIHVAKGIGCSTCHGRVDEMPLTWQESSLLMEWCLACHREPERFVRPRDQIFNMTWEPASTEEGVKLVREYAIENLTSCSVCHR